MNLALFDFDGTITNADMYTGFLHYSASKPRKIIGNLLLLPFYLMYKLGWFPARNMRSVASYIAFSQRKYDVVDAIAFEFSQKIIPHHVRAHALEKIHWHKNNGDEVVIVSGSLDIYLKYWCRDLGLKLICSELEIKKGRLSGYYVSGDCSCKEKPKRVLANFKLENYESIYAYGDTPEDLDMLEIADSKYMNWEKLDIKNTVP